MSIALLPSAWPAAAPEPPRAAAPCLVWAGPGHPERASLQAFIAAGFAQAYGAQVRHFCDTLVGCRGPDGSWAAALGYTLGRDGRFFLEQYLDKPVEEAIARLAGVPVGRASIVEVGNLTARSAGAARQLIGLMTHHLHGQGLRWVTFTATRALLNSFTRLRLQPAVLGDADPTRLPGGAADWGTYYATSPKVMFGNIGSGHAQLVQQRGA
ncbi:thermostable hemolysin [Pseudoduganella flava]|uniref:Thermostable hemolysin n=1 Tax=Pseudoduganella flava TaxID=871742 RepID=A0A562Q0Y0_9BURK|nr:thermostable hemolysin [Pseudoduganella flava]QGZ38150.1 hypothetical protein GO485_03200 [Pseudoduganella flava]TWI50329.1 thermostable hemolysin [Pseudoduganella flava]